MKKITKKILTIFSLMAMLTIGCVGCGDKKNTEVTNNDKKTATSGEKMHIIVGGKEDGQPYIYTENGEVKGFEADMWKEIAQRANFEVEYKYNSISGLFGLLDTKQVDTISHFLGMTDQRKEKYDFSDAYAKYGLKFMVKSDTPDITKIEDLYGKKVAIALGSAAAGVIQKLDPDGKIELCPYEEFRSIPKDIDNGRIYAYFGNPVTMQGDIKNMKLDCKICPKAFTETYIGYPFRKDDPNAEEYKKRINKALADMEKEGIIKKLSEKWFFMDVTEGK